MSTKKTKIQKQTSISPEKYKGLLSKVDLIEIKLINSNSNLDWKRISSASLESGSPKLDLKDDSSYVITKNQSVITYSWVLNAYFEKDKTDFLNISASFNIILSITEKLPDDFWDVYQKSTLPLIVYPYFREFVQSITSRMNIPPLTLPILFR